jgi:hypothetical protein
VADPVDALYIPATHAVHVPPSGAVVQRVQHTPTSSPCPQS